MPTWDELVKNRTAMPNLRHSGHMLECMRLVKFKHPEAQIAVVGDKWKLVEMGTDLSNEHTSQYACWAEARKIMESL